jgi:hypothetical protein
MAIPFAGWIGAALQLGFTFWTAWELFELWREFTNSKEDEEEQNKSPTLSTSTTPIVEGAGGAAFGMYSKPGMQPNPAPAKYNPAADSQAANITTPTPASYSNEGRTAPTPMTLGSGGAPSTPPTRLPTADPNEAFSFKKYFDLVGKAESGSNYSGDNNAGYVGKYAFGAAALETFGYLKPGSSKDNRMAVYNPENYTGKDGIKSVDDFKNSQQVQEKAMMALTESNFKQLKGMGVIKGDESASQLAGTLYAAHHGGVGNAKKLILEGQDTKDFLYGDKATVQKSMNKMVAAYGGGGGDIDRLGGNKTTSASAGLGDGTALAQNNPPAKLPPSPLATLMASMPNAGSLLESLTGNYEDVLRAMQEKFAPNQTNITNNTVANAGQQGSSNLPSVYDNAMVQLMDRAIYGSA